MTTLREAAKQALEALESGLAFSTHSPVLQNLRAALAEDALQRLTDVQQEIEAALEQPEQRRPLTIKEINAMPEAKGYWPMGMNDRIVRLIRAIEQAHGIKETP